MITDSENFSLALRNYLGQLDKLNVHSLIVQKDAKVIAEAYWKPYNAEEKQMMFSVSKSFTAVAMMFALQDNLCDLDTHIYSILRDKINFVPNEKVQKVTIKDLLTMTFGHYEVGVQKFYLEDDWLAEALNLDLRDEPGTKFFYDNRCPFLISVIIQELTGKHLLDYLQEKLFDFLDIYDVTWEQNAQGYDKGSYGLSLKTRDLAKFGQFILQRGKWQGEQLLASKYIDAMLSVQIATDNDYMQAEPLDNKQGYGFYFWKCALPNAFRAAGMFGQYCIILPDFNAVIAITSGAEKSLKQPILTATWDFLKALKAKSYVLDEDTRDYMQSLQIALPEDDNSIDDYLIAQEFKFADNNLGIERLLLMKEKGKLKLELCLEGRDLILYASKNSWQENLTSDEELYKNDKFDSCSTVFFENPYLAYGWQRKVLTVKIVYNQGVFVDTLKLQFVKGKLKLKYRSAPLFSLRVVPTVISSM